MYIGLKLVQKFALKKSPTHRQKARSLGRFFYVAVFLGVKLASDASSTGASGQVMMRPAALPAGTYVLLWFLACYLSQFLSPYLRFRSLALTFPSGVHAYLWSIPGPRSRPVCVVPSSFRIGKAADAHLWEVWAGAGACAPRLSRLSSIAVEMFNADSTLPFARAGGACARVRACRYHITPCARVRAC